MHSVDSHMGVTLAGVLFRMYPGPFQVYRRGSDPTSGLDMLQLIHTQDSMPTLREVALNILPSA